MLFYLLQINIMQLFTRDFDGARRYFDTEISLLSVAGYGTRFAEFNPQRFIGCVFMFELLKRFLNLIFSVM